MFKINTGKCGPETTAYWDAFHAVSRWERFEKHGFYVGKSINVIQHRMLPVISLLDIRKTIFSLDPVTLKSLYFSPISSLSLLNNNLTKKYWQKILILLTLSKNIMYVQIICHYIFYLVYSIDYNALFIIYNFFRSKVSKSDHYQRYKVKPNNFG